MLLKGFYFVIDFNSLSDVLPGTVEVQKCVIRVFRHDSFKITVINSSSFVRSFLNFLTIQNKFFENMNEIPK